MCFLVLGYTGENKLICGFNRDEYYTRLWKPTQYWPEYRSIFGQDEKSNGTWLAINENLDFLAITNIRLSPDKKTYVSNLSRGSLFENFQKSKKTPVDWLKTLEQQVDPNYYNLIVGNIRNKEFYQASRMHDQFKVKSLKIPFCISNAWIDDAWEKTQRGFLMFENLLDQKKDTLDDTLLLLSDTSQSKLIPETGLSSEIEIQLSPFFVSSNIFGTVSSAAYLVDTISQTVHVKEQGFKPNAVRLYSNEFKYSIEN